MSQAFASSLTEKRDPRLLRPHGSMDDRPRARLSIGKDLDGCYYLFDAAVFEAGRELGYIDRGAKYLPAQRWEFYEDYDLDLDTFLRLCNEAADLGLLWSQDPMPGTTATWQDLARAGHDLHVKTDRSFGTHPLASEVATRMWLASNRLTHKSLTFGRDKTAGPAVDIMLEDKLENYDALAAAGVEVWLIDRRWNQDDGTRRRVYSHEEFATRVDALARRRGEAIVAEGAEVEADGEGWRARVFA